MTKPPLNYEEFYHENEPLYKRLLEEVGFIVSQALVAADIKIHSHGGRVKDLTSVVEKIKRKGYADPYAEIEDTVGYRIVCLFAADLESLADIVRANFTVIKEEGKGRDVADPDTFGYMSDHYICTLNASYSGARYDRISGMKIEIQCRTILMDAWANVSHYLAYKGDASIPGHLRRDFYALSGLFYVADRHFELFFDTARSSAKEVLAKAVTGSIDDDAINLETVQALLRQLYGDHQPADLASISEFVEEVVPLGYASIKNLREKLEGVKAQAEEYEKTNPPGGERGFSYLDIGMARNSLQWADPRYEPPTREPGKER